MPLPDLLLGEAERDLRNHRQLAGHLQDLQARPTTRALEASAVPAEENPGAKWVAHSVGDGDGGHNDEAGIKYELITTIAADIARTEFSPTSLEFDVEHGTLFTVSTTSKATVKVAR